jgi:alkanesulfonate monooxygenase SsuD/methylene tetrahydromethanopterin reductase-like flavin-dependent oxidoreductase (luciferase family)
VAQPLTHREFTRRVGKQAKAMGWQLIELNDPERRGAPTLGLRRRGELLFCFLLGDDEPVGAEMQQWRDDLAAKGAAVFVWRQRDWDEIRRVLK